MLMSCVYLLIHVNLFDTRQCDWWYPLCLSSTCYKLVNNTCNLYVTVCQGCVNSVSSVLLFAGYIQ